MISVVVPAYNVAGTLGQCLASLLHQTANRDSYEIIVVDDGSTDKTAEVAQACGVQLIRQANGGAGAARNTGAQQSRGDIVLFVDADSVPDSNWLAAMTQPFSDATIAGASGEKKTRQQNVWARLVQFEYDFKYDRIAAHSSVDFIDSSTAAYRREVFLSNGGFDTTLKEAEDVDLSFRLAERGHKMALVRNAIVYHTHPESLSEYVRRKFQYARWRGLVYSRYPRKAASDTRTPQTQKLQALLAIAFIPALLGGLVWNLLAWASLVIILLFAVMSFPFALYCWRRNWQVGLVAPVAMGGAAYAGALGAIVGILKQPEPVRSNTMAG